MYILLDTPNNLPIIYTYTQVSFVLEVQVCYGTSRQKGRVGGIETGGGHGREGGRERKEEGSEVGMIHSRVSTVAKGVTTSNMKTVERWQRYMGHHSNAIPVARLKQN